MSKHSVLELFSLLEKFGVKHIICSPGSRNAYLLQVADQNDNLIKHVVVDERTAGFIGLGISMVERSPVALVCTSGSALLNYGPAVAEAYYKGIPLIIISADRPQEWIDQDDSQTIRQPGALGAIVKASYNLNGDIADEEGIWYNNRLINEGLSLALKGKKGPVHFNVSLNGNQGLVPEIRRDVRKINYILPNGRLDKFQINDFAEKASGKKIMIVAGFLSPDNKLQRAISILERLPNVCIMAETVSNLHLPTECYQIDPVFFTFDSKYLQDFQPDVIISIGGALISRKLKEYLRGCHAGQNWFVGYSHNLIDCFKSVTDIIEADAASFMSSFAKRLSSLQKKIEKPGIPEYKKDWKQLRGSSYKPDRKFPWSDLSALESVLKSIPGNSNLFLSNGTSVRYAQIIPHKIPHAVFSNRGVSGIEGCTSTAVGCSLVYDNLTCLITGDMSFGYDLGGLATGMIPETLRIIVLDNLGGDIFRFIPATKNLEIREKYLCTESQPNVEEIAKAFGFEYFYADNPETLEKILKVFFKKANSARILHLFTGLEKKNSEILTNYLRNI